VGDIGGDRGSSILVRNDSRDVAEVVVATDGECGFTVVVEGDGLGDWAGTAGAADAPRR
jgi:hypothetical protein